MFGLCAAGRLATRVFEPIPAAALQHGVHDEQGVEERGGFRGEGRADLGVELWLGVGSLVLGDLDERGKAGQFIIVAQQFLDR